MVTRIATCRCTQLRATCTGEPVRVSVCHCLACQKRTGSAFGAQARWPEDRVWIEGQYKIWTRLGDSGSRAVYRFCPDCGSTVFYSNDGLPGLVAIPLGNFAEPAFPAPRHSIFERSKHDWVAVLGDEIEHSAAASTK